MAKRTLKTGETVETSGIYATAKGKEITLSKGDTVPPVNRKATTVKLKRATKK